jgi:hypothetical protein
VALTAIPQPYGLRDIKVATLDATGTKGTLVDLPAAQTMDFSEKTAEKALRGDDAVKAKRVTIDEIAWTLESGGISFEASVVIFGGTIATSGVTPNQLKSWTRLETDAYPDFYAIGQAMSETGGDMHLCLFRNKANQLSGTLTDQEFWVTHAEGTAFGSLNATDIGKVWSFIQHETAAAVA